MRASRSWPLRTGARAVAAQERDGARSAPQPGSPGSTASGEERSRALSGACTVTPRAGEATVRTPRAGEATVRGEVVVEEGWIERVPGRTR